jgi:hypothetical protein
MVGGDIRVNASRIGENAMAIAAWRTESRDVPLFSAAPMRPVEQSTNAKPP